MTEWHEIEYMKDHTYGPYEHHSSVTDLCVDGMSMADYADSIRKQFVDTFAQMYEIEYGDSIPASLWLDMMTVAENISYLNKLEREQA